jgi:hypothetical protein
MSECKRQHCHAEGETRANYGGYCCLEHRDYDEYEDRIYELEGMNDNLDCMLRDEIDDCNWYKDKVKRLRELLREASMHIEPKGSLLQDGFSRMNDLDERIRDALRGGYE